MAATQVHLLACDARVHTANFFGPLGSYPEFLLGSYPEAPPSKNAVDNPVTINEKLPVDEWTKSYSETSVKKALQ